MNFRHALGVGFVTSFASCLGPTEIVLEITTDVACSDDQGVAIAIGKPGDDTTSPAAVSTTCSAAGNVGSLVVVPSGASDGVGIRVMMGVDASVEACDEAHGFAGCIVARRALQFVPHHSLELPIALERDCLGRKCSADSTCIATYCVDASVSCDEDGSCALPDAGTSPACVTSPQPVLVASGARAMSPHIARTPGGYVVTWMAGGLFQAMALGSDGAPSSQPILLGLIANVATSAVGPIGSDGSRFETFFFDGANTWVLAGGLDAGAPSQGGMGAIPLAGVVTVDAGVFESFFSWSAGNQLYVVAPSSPPMPIPVFAPPGADAGATFGLSQAGAYVYPSFAAGGSCYVLRCDASMNCTTADARPSCDFVRFAPNAAGSYAETLTSAGGMHMFAANGTEVITADTPDQLDALIPVMTTGMPFAMLRHNDVLEIVTNLPAGTPLDGTSTGYSKQGLGLQAGFDVVADDPSASPGYAVVYWKWAGGSSNPALGNVYFSHGCAP